MDVSLSELGVGDGQGGLVCCDSYIDIHTHTTFYPSVRHLVHITILAIGNNAAMNTSIHISFQISAFVFNEWTNSSKTCDDLELLLESKIIRIIMYRSNSVNK